MVHQLKRALLVVFGHAGIALELTSSVAWPRSALKRVFKPSSRNNPATRARPKAEALASCLDRIQFDCIQSRRTICGKILKVLPDGFVIDSGYTNIMRDPLNHSWLVPGSVKARRAASLVEGDQPACVCVGLVFLTDLPKKPVANVYDYVNLTAYPTGQCTYTSGWRCPANRPEIYRPLGWQAPSG